MQQARQEFTIGGVLFMKPWCLRAAKHMRVKRTSLRFAAEKGMSAKRAWGALFFRAIGWQRVARDKRKAEVDVPAVAADANVWE